MPTIDMSWPDKRLRHCPMIRCADVPESGRMQSWFLLKTRFWKVHCPHCGFATPSETSADSAMNIWNELADALVEHRARNVEQRKEQANG